MIKNYGTKVYEVITNIKCIYIDQDWKRIYIYMKAVYFINQLFLSLRVKIIGKKIWSKKII